MFLLARSEAGTHHACLFEAWIQDRRHIVQQLKSREDRSSRPRRLCAGHHFCLAGFRGIWPNALAIDVHDKGVEAEVTEHLGAFVGVFANAHPFRKYENTRPLGSRIVPDRKSLAFISVVFVFDDGRLEHYRLPDCQFRERCRTAGALRQLMTDPPHRFGEVRVATLTLLTLTAVSGWRSCGVDMESVAPRGAGGVLEQRATYRITISIMGRQMSLDIVWEGRWSTITVKVV